MQWCCHSPLKTLPSAPPLSLSLNPINPFPTCPWYSVSQLSHDHPSISSHYPPNFLSPFSSSPPPLLLLQPTSHPISPPPTCLVARKPSRFQPSRRQSDPHRQTEAYCLPVEIHPVHPPHPSDPIRTIGMPIKG